MTTAHRTRPWWSWAGPVTVLVLGTGCVHEDDLEEPVLVRPVPRPAAAFAPAPVVEAEPAPPPAAPRRLDHVVTLGETTYQPYVPGAPAAPAAPAAGGTTIVINNNVGAPAIYGYGGFGYGGYGYGGYGGTGARGSGAPAAAAPRMPELGTAAQAAPAAPGQTPAIGGNWPTIPSYGPRPMR